MGKRSGKKDIVELGKETQFRSGAEAAEKGRRGGVKSGETRRAKRDARQAAQKLLHMAAKGKMRENLLEMGYSTKGGEEIENIDVIVARLMVQAASGNLEASARLLKIAGYDYEENRIERESINADRRRDRESEARLDALSKGNVERYSTAYSDGDDDEAVEDVFIYLPDNGRDKDLNLTKVAEEATDTDEETDSD